MYVDIKEKDKRKTFLYFLEGKDFSAYHFTRKFIVDSELPFDVDIEKKKFTLINSAKLNSGIILLSIEEAMNQIK